MTARPRTLFERRPDRWRENGTAGVCDPHPRQLHDTWHAGGVHRPVAGPGEVAPPAASVTLRALAYAYTAYVDGGGWDFMGGSHGGTTTWLPCRPRNDAEALAEDRRAGFAAGWRAIPGCASDR